MRYAADCHEEFRPTEPPTREQVDALLALEEALVQDRPDASLRIAVWTLLERLRPTGATILPSSVDLCESIEPYLGRTVVALGDCCMAHVEPERGVYRDFAKSVRRRFGMDGEPLP